MYLDDCDTIPSLHPQLSQTKTGEKFEKLHFLDMKNSVKFINTEITTRGGRALKNIESVIEVCAS